MIINNSLHAYYIILLHKDLNADDIKVCIIVYSYTNDLHVCCTTMICTPSYRHSKSFYTRWGLLYILLRLKLERTSYVAGFNYFHIYGTYCD